MTKLITLKFALSAAGTSAVAVAVVPTAVILQEKNANNPNNLLNNAINTINKSNINAKPNVMVSNISNDTIGSNIVGMPKLPVGLNTQFQNVKANATTGITTFQIEVIAPNNNKNISDLITVKFQTNDQVNALENLVNDINKATIIALPNILTTSISQNQSFADQISGMPAIPNGMTFTYQNININNQTGFVNFNVLITDTDGNTAITSTITASGFVTASDQQIVDKIVENINGAKISAIPNTLTTVINDQTIGQYLNGVPAAPTGITYNFQNVNVDSITGQTTFQISVTGSNGVRSISKLITINFLTPAQAIELQSITDQINKAIITAAPNVLTVNISKNQSFANQIQGMPTIPNGMTFTYQNINANVSNNEASFDVLVTDIYGHTMTSAVITAVGFETITESSNISKVVNGINNATIIAKQNIDVSLITDINIATNIVGVPVAPSNITYKYINVIPNASTGVTTFNIQVVGSDSETATSNTISVTFETTPEKTNITNIINNINSANISAKANIDISTINEANIGINLNGIPIIPVGFKIKYQNVTPNLDTGVTTFNILVTGTNSNTATSKTLTVNFETSSQANTLADIIKEINKSTITAVNNTLTTNVFTNQNFANQISGMPAIPNDTSFTYQNINVNNTTGNVTFNVLVIIANGNNAISSTITATGFVTPDEQQLINKLVDNINEAKISAIPNTSTSGITNSNISQHINGLPIAQPGIIYNFQDLNIDSTTGQTSFKIAVNGKNGSINVSKTIIVNFQTPAQAVILQNIVDKIEKSVILSLSNIFVSDVSINQDFANQISGMPAAPEGLSFTYQNISVNKTNGQATFDILVTDSYGHTLNTSNIVAKGFETVTEEDNIKKAVNAINIATNIAANANISITTISQNNISANINGVPIAPQGMTYQYQNVITNNETGISTFNIKIIGLNGNTGISNTISVQFETILERTNIANAIKAINTAVVSANPNTIISLINQNNISTNITGVPIAPQGMTYQYQNVITNNDTGTATFNIKVTNSAGNSGISNVISVNFESPAQTEALANIIANINKAIVIAIPGIVTTEISENQGFANQISGMPKVPNGMTFIYQNIVNKNTGSVTFSVLVTDANKNTATSATITATKFISPTEQQAVNKAISNINEAVIIAVPNISSTLINDLTIAKYLQNVPVTLDGLTYTYQNVTIDSTTGQTTFTILINGANGATGTSNQISVNFETPEQANALQTIVNNIEHANISAKSNILVTSVSTDQNFATQISGMPAAPANITFTYQNINVSTSSGIVTFNVLVKDINGHSVLSNKIIAGGFVTQTEQDNIAVAVNNINSATIVANQNILVNTIDVSNISTNISGVPPIPEKMTYEYINFSSSLETGIITFNIKVIGSEGNSGISNQISVNFESTTQVDVLKALLEEIKVAIITAKSDIPTIDISTKSQIFATQINGMPIIPTNITFTYQNIINDNSGSVTFDVLVTDKNGNTQTSEVKTATGFVTPTEQQNVNKITELINEANISAKPNISIGGINDETIGENLNNVPIATNGISYAYSNVIVESKTGQTTFNIIVTGVDGAKNTSKLITVYFETSEQINILSNIATQIKNSTIIAVSGTQTSAINQNDQFATQINGMPTNIPNGIILTYQDFKIDAITGQVTFDVLVSDNLGNTALTNNVIATGFVTTTQQATIDQNIKNINDATIKANTNTLTTGITNDNIVGNLSGVPAPVNGANFTYQDVSINVTTGTTTFKIKVVGANGANGLSNEITAQFETPAQLKALEDITALINKATIVAVPNTLVSAISIDSTIFATQISGMPPIPANMTFTYENIINSNNGSASFSVIVTDNFGNFYTSVLINATKFETSTQQANIAVAIKSIDDANIIAKPNISVLTVNNLNIESSINGAPTPPNGITFTYQNVEPDLITGSVTFTILVKDVNGNSDISRQISANFVSPIEEENINKIVDNINNAKISAQSNIAVSTINESNIEQNINNVPVVTDGFKYQYINVETNLENGLTTFNILVTSSKGNTGTSQKISVNFESPAQSTALDKIIAEIQSSTITDLSNITTTNVAVNNSQAFSTQISGMPNVPTNMTFTYQEISVNNNTGNVTFKVLVTGPNGNTRITTIITATGFVTPTEQQIVDNTIKTINEAKISAILNTSSVGINDATIATHLRDVPTPITGIKYQYKFVSINPTTGQTTFKIQVNGLSGAVSTSNQITVHFQTATQTNDLASVIAEIKAATVTALSNISTTNVSLVPQKFIEQITGMPDVPKEMTFIYQNIKVDNSNGNATFQVLVSNSYGDSLLSEIITAMGFETPTEAENINNAINTINNATAIIGNKNILVTNINDANIATNITGVPSAPENMIYKYINVKGDTTNGNTTFNIQVTGPNRNSRISNQITVNFQTAAQASALASIIKSINDATINAVLNTLATAISTNQTFANQITGMPKIPDGMTFIYQNIKANVISGEATFNILVTGTNGNTATSNTITANSFVSPSEQNIVDQIIAKINGADITSTNSNLITSDINVSNIASKITNVPEAPAGIKYTYQNFNTDPITGITTFKIVVTGADGATNTSKLISVNFISPAQLVALNNIIAQINTATITGLPSVSIINIHQNNDFGGQIFGMPSTPSGMSITYQNFNLDTTNGSVNFKVTITDLYNHSIISNTLTARNFQTAAETAELQTQIDIINKASIIARPNILTSAIEQNVNFINQVNGMPIAPNGMTYTYQDFNVNEGSGVVTFSILVTDAQGHTMLSSPVLALGFKGTIVIQTLTTFMDQLKKVTFLANPNILTTSVATNNPTVFSTQIAGMPFIPPNISVVFQDISIDSTTGTAIFKLLITLDKQNFELSPDLQAINFETLAQLEILKGIVNSINTNTIKAVPNSEIAHVTLLNLPSKLVGQPIAPNGYTYQYVNFSINGTTGVATFGIKVTNSQGNYFTTASINVTFLSPTEQQLLNDTISKIQNASWTGISTLLVTSPKIISDLANNINGTPSIPSGWTITFKNVSIAANAQYHGGITFKVLLTDELGNTILSSNIIVYGYQTLLTKINTDISNAVISAKTDFIVTRDININAGNILNYINISGVTIPASINIVVTDFNLNTTTGVASFNLQSTNEGGVRANTGKISVTFAYYPTLNSIASYSNTLAAAGASGTFNVSSSPLLLGQFQPEYLHNGNAFNNFINTIIKMFANNNYAIPSYLSVETGVASYAWKPTAQTSSSGVPFGNGDIKITLKGTSNSIPNYVISYQTDWIPINTITLAKTQLTAFLQGVQKSFGTPEMRVPWIPPTSPVPIPANHSTTLAQVVMNSNWYKTTFNENIPFLVAPDKTYNFGYWPEITAKVTDAYFSNQFGNQLAIGSGYVTINWTFNLFGTSVSSNDIGIGKIIIKINPTEAPLN